MPATVIVNNLTVVHKSSGGTAIAAPDVCKTPTPGGPVPVPYVNTALSRHTARGSRRVRMDGHPIMLKSSHISTSSGDDPGTLGGVISGKFKGKAYPRSYSLDVKVENQPVFRLGDMMVNNCGSPANGAGAVGQPNNAAVAAGPSQPAELVKMRWSRSTLCCGDEVTLTVETRNAEPDQLIRVGAFRTDTECAVMDRVFVETTSARVDKPWISRWRGPYEEEIPAVGQQRTLQGEETTSNTLWFQNPPKKIGPETEGGEIPVPRYEQEGKTDRWVKGDRQWGIRYMYDIELDSGQVIVTRELDFQLGPGVDPASYLFYRDFWKTQIEGVWDYQYYLHRVNCERGKGCDCALVGCCKYPLRIRVAFGKKHGSVRLFAGAPPPGNWDDPDKWWRSHTWWMQTGESCFFYTRPHEFGHLIGCYDEYPAGACHPSRMWENEPMSIMAYGCTVETRHVDRFRAWLKAKVASIVGPVELVRIGGS